MGTRGSALALAQSSHAARALEKLSPGLTVETVVIKTTGDMFGAPSPEVAKTLPQGAKGLWIKELEEAQAIAHLGSWVSGLGQNDIDPLGVRLDP